VVFLPGETSPHARKGDAEKAERGVSRRRSSAAKPSRAAPEPRKPLLREGPNGEESETDVSLEDARHQKSRQLELPLGGVGVAPVADGSGEVSTATRGNVRSGTDDACLMDRVVERDNVIQALKRVQKNKGSPGIDGMTVEQLRGHLRETWPVLREQLLAGAYRPRPVKRQLIPKSTGGMRELGIPTALDRFIQQALLQVLQPRFDPSFSAHSHGFRPGRRAHDAVCEAQRYIQEGRHWVVDVDLEKFFDRVNHDVMMGKLVSRIADKRVLGLIRRYLDAGIMANGVVTERHEGTPQGGPLSPLLANVLLDEVDKELEKRGHAFVRYADDCNVYVRSRRAGERVMKTLRRLFARLRLRINESKSAVAHPWDRKLLGYSFWVAKDGTVKRRIAEQALAAMRDRVRSITIRHGRSLPSIIVELRGYLVGWKNYFRLAETPRTFRDLDSWLRHRLRAIQLKHWRNPPTILRELRARGLPRRDAWEVATNAGRWWRHSARTLNRALPVSLYDRLGLPRLAA
jgi:RNA-directed DNA polymerase